MNDVSEGGVDTPSSATQMPSLEDTMGDPTRPMARRRSSPPREIGHYLILGELGRGGMGVVYSAYDRELDRKLAIKRIHARESAEAQERLVREAKAMARLAHPNVVQIFEIGQHEGSAFLAMEFVEGETLGAWLDHEAKAPWRKRLAPLLAAGRGLAAAHEQGLVHRDFKPDNVMIDRNGRARVMDFGIARGEADELETSTNPEASEPLEANALTRAGAVLGTPAYMAPEQLAGGVADARSDQFGFCVTLWEALYGQRPFSADNLAQLYVAVSSGRPTAPPRQTDVPGWARRIIERGLAPEPEDRWPSMAALLAALEADPTRRRRVALGVLVVVGVVGGGTLLYRGRAEAERRRVAEACAQEAAAISEVWNPEVAAELERVFMGTDKPFAADAWSRTAPAFDGFAASWSQLNEQACTEVRVEGTRSEESLAGVRGCLGEARAALAASVEVLGSADALVVSRGPGLVAELPRLEQCVDEAALARRIAPPRAAEEQLEQLRLRLARGTFLGFAGRHEEALAEAEALHEVAAQLEWKPFEAEVLWLVGYEQGRLGHHEDAAASLGRSFALAGESHADEIALRAAISLIHMTGRQLAHEHEALAWDRVADMLIQRLGLTGELVEGRRRAMVGDVYMRLGDIETAVAELGRAHEITEQQLGPNDVSTASALADLAMNEALLGSFDVAEEHIRRSLAVTERALGPTHPRFAAGLATLCNILDERGRFEEARDACTRTLEIRELAFGPEHPLTGGAALNLGVVEIHQGNYDAALRAFERALEIAEVVYGPRHPRLASPLNNIASVHFARGSYEEARGRFERVLSIIDPERPEHPGYLGNYARVLMELGDPERALVELERACELAELQGSSGRSSLATVLRQRSTAEILLERYSEALASAERARQIYEQLHGPEHGEVGASWYHVGLAQLRLGRVDEAIASLERGVEVQQDAGWSTDMIVATRFALAKARWAAGEHEAARTLATRTREEALEQGHDERARDIEAWLREPE